MDDHEEARERESRWRAEEALRNPVEQQAPPREGRIRIIDLVMGDLAQRAETGRIKYGVYLHSHNGRDPLVDAYQEALDLCMYLRQCIVERDEVGS